MAAAPKNGQAALDLSFTFSSNTPRRVGVDVAAREFVVFDRTGNLVVDKKAVGGVFHAHVRTWKELEPEMQQVLIDNGLVDKRGDSCFDAKKWDLTP